MFDKERAAADDLDSKIDSLTTDNKNENKPSEQTIVEAIYKEAEEFLFTSQQEPSTGDFQSLFRVQPITRWLEEAKRRPIPKKLFGEFWFEGEICILFADTNVGKSILAVQIGDAISKGSQIQGIGSEIGAQKVLYFDFELSEKQFEARYSQRIESESNFSHHYQFNDNFQRADINPNADIEKRFNSFEECLHFSLQHAIAVTDSKIIIIDNLTYLKNETERAKDALPLMKYLKELKNKFDLSILALAHTPKRDMSKSITRNDLQGSKMLINFCDSSFAIGESAKDRSLRYLKQIKVRNAEMKFDSDNVVLCQIVKPENYLHFEFLGYGKEREYLTVLSDRDKGELVEKAKELSAQGKSQREIASQLGISAMTVNRYLKTQ